MSWHYSQALVEDFSAAGCLDGAQSAQLRLSRSALKCSVDAKKRGILKRSQYGMMCEPSTADLGVAKWMSSLRASLVSPSRSQESDKAQTTNATGGLTPFASLEKSSPDGVCWKTCQVSLLTSTTEPYSETWPCAGLMQGGVCWVQEGLEGIVLENGYGSLPRIPRPVACDSEGSGRIHWERGHGGGMNLKDWFSMNYRFAYPPARLSEYLMGWPIGWTALEPLGMDRFRLWLQRHGSC